MNNNKTRMNIKKLVRILRNARKFIKYEFDFLSLNIRKIPFLKYFLKNTQKRTMKL